jgi:hypothetical protein
MYRFGRVKPNRPTVVRLGSKATGIPKVLGKKQTPLIRAQRIAQPL